jgi:hypothetical protein
MAALRELAAGRADMLAEVAGLERQAESRRSGVNPDRSPRPTQGEI